MPYNVGDVVNVWFAYKENGKIKLKERPAIVFKVHQETSHALIQLTGTNKTGKYPGFLVTKESEEGIEMGLTKDTFIHLEETYWVPNKFIRRLRGTYSDMDKINKAMSDFNIKPKRQIID
jgi:hypothetical protein